MRISIEVSPEQHRHIKTMAAYNGTTIKDLLISSIMKNAKPTMDETEYLLATKANREHLEEGMKWLEDRETGEANDAITFKGFEEFKNEYNL